MRFPDIKPVMVAGLTGGIGCGKSTVASLFKRLGAHIVDADYIARELVAPGEPALKEIVKTFGKKVLKKDGSLDRKGLANIVFHDKVQLKKLDKIMDKRIHQRAMSKIKFLARQNQFGNYGLPFSSNKLVPAVIIYEAALLIEAKVHKQFDRVIVVGCTPEVQLWRVVERDKCSEEHARARIAAQMPLGMRKRHASYFIDTDSPMPAVEQRVREVMELLRQVRI